MTHLGKSLDEMISISKERQYPMEFSSALPYSQQLKEVFLDYPFPKLAHNYFPAPKVPFVLNLASNNPHIRQQSIEHCIRGIQLTKQVNAPFFAAHAGFCLDPKPEELGKKLKQSDEKIDKSLHWGIFLNSVNEILKFAEEENIDFLIENNVVAQMNITVLGQNPLLCGDSKEMLKLIEAINHPNFGILLDTAHLKVSSNTLNFNKYEHTKIISPYVKAIHHSDNEGSLDNNQCIPENYWFFNFKDTFKNIPHVLEVKKIEPAIIDKQLERLSKFQ